jgi:hypothetical protein
MNGAQAHNIQSNYLRFFPALSAFFIPYAEGHGQPSVVSRLWQKKMTTRIRHSKQEGFQAGEELYT